MQLNGEVNRVINSEGNQELQIVGVVTPHGSFEVLPNEKGSTLQAEVTHVESSGGFVTFVLKIQAIPPVAVVEAAVPAPVIEPAKESEPSNSGADDGEKV